jgi:serine palmitoyltransferase
MGTFTKSFGSVGGYVAGSKELINFLRTKVFAFLYGSSLPPVCSQQISSALDIITGKDGTDLGKKKIQKIYRNAEMIRKGLTDLGFEIIGSVGSPVVIIMTYIPAKIKAFSNMCIERGVAVVCVGAPAVDPNESRIRICCSSSIKKKDVIKTLQVLSEIGDLTCSKYLKYKNQSYFKTILDHIL